MFEKETFFEMIRDGIPGLYLFDGHPANDIIVKPMDLLRESINSDIDTIIKYLGLSEDMPNDILDAIAANYRINRGDGSYAVGVVTIAASIPMEFNPSGVVFVSNNGLLYKPTQLTPVREISYSKVSNYYVVRLNVKAELKGADYNVEVGAISSVEGLSFSPLFISNESIMVGGSDEQSNASVISAINNSITDRSLTRKTGLIVKLLELHPELNWFKIVGAGEPEMIRDIYYVDNKVVHLGNSADVYVYPNVGYTDGTQLLGSNISYNSVSIDSAPAIGPYKVIDSNGEISDIYWEIETTDVGYCNSMRENKTVLFKNPKNKFLANTSGVSFFEDYGVSIGDIFYDGTESVVIGVSENKIYINDIKEDKECVVRTYSVVYPQNNGWASSPYINYSISDSAYTLMDTGGITDFLTIITETDPHLKLYMVEIEDTNGNIHFHDIDHVYSDRLVLESNDEFNYSPKQYRIVKSNVMEKLFSVKVENWIDPWHYFRASIVSPEGELIRMSEDLIFPIVSQVKLDSVYMEISGGYYKVTGIEYEGQTLYISIKYDSAEQNESALINQDLYLLEGNGKFSGNSSISDISSGDVSLYFRTYILDNIQEDLDNDQNRIVTVDYLAKIPYEAEVKVNVRYKGEASEGAIADAISEFINAIEPINGDNTDGKLLQASDLIDVCYGLGVDYVDLSTFTVKILVYVPDSKISRAIISQTEYEIKGEDISKDYVFKYISTVDDIEVEKIL